MASKRRDIRPSQGGAGGDRPAFEVGNRWAIIIGISKYQHEKLNLRYAHRDAQALYDLIRTPAGGGFKESNIEFLLDEEATTRKITRALRGFMKKPAREDVVLIYLACHGAADPERTNVLYLLTHDTDPDDISTGLPMREIDSALKENLLAERVVVIADTCHSAGLGGGIGRRSGHDDSARMNAYLRQLNRSAPGLALLTSAEANESSLESEKWGGGHGVFTHFLLEGMRGEADASNDGIVTVGELFEYVRDNVKKATDHKQHPSIGTNSFDRRLPLAMPGRERARQAAEEQKIEKPEAETEPDGEGSDEQRSPEGSAPEALEAPQKDAPEREDTEAESKSILGRLTVESAIQGAIVISFGAVMLAIFANIFYGSFTEESYLKSPQRLTLAEYLDDPSHPRAGPLFFLSVKPSTEVILVDLEIKHIDEDSILFADPTGVEVLVPGEEMNTLGLSVGQPATLQVGALEATPLGWVPGAPELDDLLLDHFDSDEQAALARWKIVTGETAVAGDYVRPATLSFSDIVPQPEITLSLAEIAESPDLSARLTSWRANLDTVAIRGVRLIEQAREREPYFVVENDEGHEAAVAYDPGTFSEWYWALDRLQGEQVFVRGVPRAADDPDFAIINIRRDGKLLLLLDGYVISDPGGTKVINLGTRPND